MHGTGHTISHRYSRISANVEPAVLTQCALDPDIVHVRAYLLVHVGVTSSSESFVSKTGSS